MQDTLEIQKINTDLYVESLGMHRVLVKMGVENHQMTEMSILDLLDTSHLDLIPKAILSIRAEEVKMNASSGHGESNGGDESIPCNQIREDFLASFLTHEIISPTHADRCAEIKFKNQETGEIDLEVHLHGEFHSANKVAVAALSFSENPQIATTARVLLWKFLENHSWEMGKGEREDTISLNLQQQVERLKWLWDEYSKTEDVLNNTYEDPAIVRFINSEGIKSEIEDLCGGFVSLVAERKRPKSEWVLMSTEGQEEFEALNSNIERGKKYSEDVVVYTITGSEEIGTELRSTFPQSRYDLNQYKNPAEQKWNRDYVEGINLGIQELLNNPDYINKLDLTKVISRLCDLQDVQISSTDLVKELKFQLDRITSAVDGLDNEEIIRRTLTTLGIGHREISMLLNAAVVSRASQNCEANKLQIDNLIQVEKMLNSLGFFAVNIRTLTSEEHSLIGAQGQYHLIDKGNGRVDTCSHHEAEADITLQRLGKDLDEALKNAPDVSTIYNPEPNNSVLNPRGDMPRIIPREPNSSETPFGLSTNHGDALPRYLAAPAPVDISSQNQGHLEGFKINFPVFSGSTVKVEHGGSRNNKPVINSVRNGKQISGYEKRNNVLPRVSGEIINVDHGTSGNTHNIPRTLTNRLEDRVAKHTQLVSDRAEPTTIKRPEIVIGEKLSEVLTNKNRIYTQEAVSQIQTKLNQTLEQVLSEISVRKTAEAEQEVSNEIVQAKEIAHTENEALVSIVQEIKKNELNPLQLETKLVKLEQTLSQRIKSISIANQQQTEELIEQVQQVRASISVSKSSTPTLILEKVGTQSTGKAFVMPSKADNLQQMRSETLKSEAVPGAVDLANPAETRRNLYSILARSA
jgi:hypothetical protein